MRRKDYMTFTGDEIAAMISICSCLDADRFKHPLAKAAIAKAKAFHADPTTTRFVVRQ